MLCIAALLIPCQHDLAVTTVSPFGKPPLEDVKVTLDYNTHMLYDFDERQLPYGKANHLEQQSGSTGRTVFHDLTPYCPD